MHKKLQPVLSKVLKSNRFPEFARNPVGLPLSIDIAMINLVSTIFFNRIVKCMVTLKVHHV